MRTITIDSNLTKCIHIKNHFQFIFTQNWEKCSVLTDHKWVRTIGVLRIITIKINYWQNSKFLSLIPLVYSRKNYIWDRKDPTTDRNKDFQMFVHTLGKWKRGIKTSSRLIYRPAIRIAHSWCKRIHSTQRLVRSNGCN